jgi:hypothetical protein
MRFAAKQPPNTKKRIQWISLYQHEERFDQKVGAGQRAIEIDAKGYARLGHHHLV